MMTRLINANLESHGYFQGTNVLDFFRALEWREDCVNHGIRYVDRVSEYFDRSKDEGFKFQE